MGIVALHGMLIHGSVGVSETERRIGRNILVDVEVHTSLKEASKSDAIEDILNYELLAAAVENTLQKEYKLLEAVARDIATYIIAHNEGKITDMTIRIRKQSPFLGTETAYSFVEWQYPADY